MGNTPQPVANVINQPSNLDTLTVKVDFVDFIATVKFLGIQDLMAGALQGLLSPENASPSQDPSESV